MSWCDWRDMKRIPKIGLLLIERSLVMQMNRFLGLSSLSSVLGAASLSSSLCRCAGGIAPNATQHHRAVYHEHSRKQGTEERPQSRPIRTTEKWLRISRRAKIKVLTIVSTISHMPEMQSTATATSHPQFCTWDVEAHRARFDR